MCPIETYYYYNLYTNYVYRLYKCRKQYYVELKLLEAERNKPNHINLMCLHIPYTKNE